MYVRTKGNGWREGSRKRTRGREGGGKRGLKISICRERERKWPGGRRVKTRQGERDRET